MMRARLFAVPRTGLVPPAGDVVLAALLCLAWTVELLANGARSAPLAATMLAGWALIAPVAWRQLVPVAALAANGLLMGLAAVLRTGVFDGPHNVEGVAIAALLYSVGAHRQGRGLAVGALVGAAIVSAHAAIVGQPFGSGTVIALAAFVGVTMLTGRALSQRRVLTRELGERAALLRSEREGRARSVADEERRRIARELHDVVTHVLGAMVVQASSLSRAPRPDAGELERTLGQIERSGREALAELRRLLGVLRGGEPQPLALAPTVEQVHRLVARTRAEGLPIELRIDGQPGSPPPGIDVSAYRVVEEGLAGLREHAVRRAVVSVRCGASDTEVELWGELAEGPPPGADECRSRLAAIRERVSICGGELSSADCGGPGLFVHARLPHAGRGLVPNCLPHPVASPTPGGGGGARSRRALAGAALGCAVLGALTLDAFSGGHLHGSGALNVLTFAAIAGAVAWRRAPVATALVFAVGTVVLTTFLTPVPKLQTAQVALVLITYLTASATAGRRAALAFAVLASGVAAVMLTYGIGDMASRQVYALVTLTLLAWVAGRAMRTRALLNRALEEKAQALERERDERARAAAAHVRRQVARELHDVVAHGLTVMIVQAGSARRLADSNAEEAIGAAQLIEATGREAMGEMRRLLDVMGDDEEAAPLTATPGMDSLESLLERSRAAGLNVEVYREGHTRRLPTGVDLAAYRVVQEALTNTIKHAGASRAELVVRYREEELELLVGDDGHGPLRSSNGDGHGLVGMKERVGVYGGELEAGRGERGGFRVRARFPLETAR